MYANGNKNRYILLHLQIFGDGPQNFVKMREEKHAIYVPVATDDDDDDDTNAGCLRTSNGGNVNNS
jgi:hypothetical protein